MLPNTETNLILDTDSYKASHWLQFPPRTTGMFSYLESRGGRDPEVVFFGLQYLLKKYLTQRITPDMVKEADHFLARHGVPFNRPGWMRIAHELGGRLPVRIRAVPEGTVVPTHNVLMTVESTDPETFWIVSWLETLLMRVWYPCTVATNSRHLKQVIHRYLAATSDDPAAELPFKLHDFGSRGVSSKESAAIGGAAHLVNFQGSDTLAGVLCANTFYHHPMAAFSIPAAEHSTITAWGREGELDAYANMLDRFAKPGAVLAVVSDSYDLWNALDHLWGEQLRDRVKASGATVVLRPDSGHPATVVLRALDVLEARFGAKVNTKGFKVLDGNSYVSNQVMASLITNFSGFDNAVMVVQEKWRPAQHEEEMLWSTGGVRLAPFDSTEQGPRKFLIQHGDFMFGILVCSELTNIEFRQRYRGLVDALMVPEWNSDTETFSSIVEATAFDVHCFVIQVNNREFGDCRIRGPFKDHWRRDVARIKGGAEDYYVIGEIDFQELRQCQSTFRTPSSPFKPTPDGYQIDSRRKRLPQSD